MKHTFDAKGKPLGRLASEIARLLQGKDSPAYLPREVGENEVVVKNIKEVKLSGNKAADKVYYRHSGYVGHLKERKFEKVLAEQPEDILRRAVRGMLPKNRLAQKRLNKMTFENNG
ncbi:MAG TPA: 50S ribosomal protein L13 [Candidatus Tyrphobacter sp.]|nr:50S ribosomal protein L13 [Candidatus Tyrphobacter sp.]